MPWGTSDGKFYEDDFHEFMLDPVDPKGTFNDEPTSEQKLRDVFPFKDMVQEVGMLEKGNIDIFNRPRVKNNDGSTSTVRSLGINMDGKEVLIPTVSHDGSKILSNKEAIQQYKDSGLHLGIFDSPESSTAYAESLHKQQEEMISK